MTQLIKILFLIGFYSPVYSQVIQLENRDVKLRIEYTIQGDSLQLSGAIFNKRNSVLYVPGYFAFINREENLTFYRNYDKIEAGVFTQSFDNHGLEPKFIQLNSNDSFKLENVWVYKHSKSIEKLMLRLDYINPNNHAWGIRRKLHKNIHRVRDDAGFVFSLSRDYYLRYCDYIIVRLGE